MDKGHVREVVPGANGLPVEMLDDGLLWLINKTCFHPRGFALGYSPGQKTFVMLGDGREPWSYEIDEDAKFSAVEAVFARARLSG